MGLAALAAPRWLAAGADEGEVDHIALLSDSHIAADEINEGTDAITAEVREHDVLNPQSLSLYRKLASGFTASLVLHGSYDYRPVALSMALAILVTYEALHLVGSPKIATQGWTIWLWIVGLRSSLQVSACGAFGRFSFAGAVLPSAPVPRPTDGVRRFW